MDLFSPTQLAIAKKEAGIRFSKVFWSLFFSKETYTFSTEEVYLDKIPNKPRMAPYCSPMIGGKIERNQGYSTNSLKAPYIKSVHQVDASTAIKRRPGESLAGSMSHGERLAAAVMQNMALEEEAISMREEDMAAKMVINGGFLVEGDNIVEPYYVECNRRSENNITLSGAAKWTEQDFETFNPMDEFDRYAELSDGITNLVITDKKGWTLLKKFKKFREDLDTRRGSISEMELGLKDLGAVVSIKGNNGDVTFLVVSEELTDEKGNTEKVMPDYCFIMANKDARGVAMYGAIQDIHAQEAGTVELTRFPRDWKEDGDPAVRKTKTDAAPLPYLVDGNHFVVIKAA